MHTLYWSQPTAFDDYGRVFLQHLNHIPGQRFPIGTTNVQYIFADDSYNIAVCKFIIFVYTGKPTNGKQQQQQHKNKNKNKKTKNKNQKPKNKNKNKKQNKQK